MTTICLSLVGFCLVVVLLRGSYLFGSYLLCATITSATSTIVATLLADLRAHRAIEAPEKS